MRAKTQTLTLTLRFEPDQHIPVVGDSWETRTELGNRPVRVKLLKVKSLRDHSDEPGVRLMEARISRRFLDE